MVAHDVYHSTQEAEAKRLWAWSTYWVPGNQGHITRGGGEGKEKKRKNKKNRVQKQ
jgi:hypothetical protein